MKIVKAVLLIIFVYMAQVTFAQQSIVNTSRSNIKDKPVADTAKKPVTTTSEQAKPGNPKITFPPNAKTQVTTTEQARTEQVNPPIPGVGVVVKKNPGGGASKLVTTNDKGEAEIKIAESGNYTIIFTNAANEAGGANNNAASRGGPVQGIKVGLGTNPPGASPIFATTNDKGEFEFKNLDAGILKIIVTTRNPPTAQEIKDKKTAPPPCNCATVTAYLNSIN